jgi:glycosyltransferase involved in cell wall biosynthesis
MKIAQISPLFESVPPKAYGGTERVVYHLTEELVQMGHDVTLFASGDSQTSAELRPASPESIRLANGRYDPVAWHALLLSMVAKEARDYDIVHFHTDFLHFPLTRHLAVSHVTTLHGRLDLPDLQYVYREFQDVPVISISHSQRRPLPIAHWVDTVYNGVPEGLYTYQPHAGGYLAFLGRISPEKGIETAIDIALRVGLPLKIAAKIDPVDQDYFDLRIKHLLNLPLIEYVGELDDEAKNELLGGAWALLAPIAWPEPFGLMMIESMACGTPVIAFRNGSVPELMEDGVTGYIVDGMEEAIPAVENIKHIDRRACRNHFEANFTSRRMAEDYLNAYASQCEQPQLAVV